MKIVDINGLDNSFIERDATEKEISIIQETRDTIEAIKAEEDIAKAQRAEQKAALLERLGITEEEAATIIL